MSNIHQVSASHLARLKDELAELQGPMRVAIADRIAVARSYGDLSENSEYTEAKNEQAFNEGRIQQLDELIRTAVVREENGPTSHVGFGSHVKINSSAGEEEFTIVGRSEADPRHGMLSSDSPVGKALFGSIVGQHIVVTTPGGPEEYEVLAIS